MSTAETPVAKEYDAFLSYAHEDEELASAFQLALQRLGRSVLDRLRRRFVLRVFRDATNLDANAELEESIVRALRASKHFVLLASPESAQSQWVGQEVAQWLRHPGARDRVHVVLVSGTIVSEAGRLDASRTTALSREVCELFATEPSYADLGEYAREPSTWSLRNPDYRRALLKVAAPIHDVWMDVLDRRDRRPARVVVLSIVLTVAMLAGLGVRSRLFHRLVQANRLVGDAQALHNSDPWRGVGLVEEAFEKARWSGRLGHGEVVGAESTLRELLRVSGTQRRFVAGNPLRRARASAANDRVLTAADEAVQVWETATGRKRTLFAGKIVKAAAISARGDRVVTATKDEPVRVWKWNGRGWRSRSIPLRPLDGLVAEVGFDARGHPMTADANGEVRIWWRHAGRWEPTAAMKHEEGPPSARLKPKIFRFALDADGRKMVSASRRSVWLWRVGAAAPIGAWPPHDDDSTIVDVGLTARGSRIFAATKKAVLMWDVADFPLRPREAGAFSARAVEISAAAMNAAGDLLAVALTVNGEHQVHLSNAPFDKVAVVLHGSAPIRDVAIGCGGGCVLAAGDDGIARLWDLSALATEFPEIVDGPTIVRAESLGAEGRLLAVGDGSRQGMVWDRVRRCTIATFSEPDAVFLASIATDGASLVTASRSGRVHRRPLDPSCAGTVLDDADDLWSLEAGSPLNAIAVDEPRARVLTASGDRVALWETRRRPPTARDLDVTEVVAARFSSDGDQVVTATSTGLQLWDSATGKRATEDLSFAEPATMVAFDCAASSAAIAGGATVRLWNVTARHAGASLSHSEPVDRIALACDGSLAAAAAGDDVRLWRTDTGALVDEWQTGFAVVDLAFGADAGLGHGLLAATGRGGGIAIWGIAERAIVSRPSTERTPQNDRPRSTVSFAASDTLLLSTVDGAVRVLGREAFAPLATLRREFDASEDAWLGGPASLRRPGSL